MGNNRSIEHTEHGMNEVMERISPPPIDEVNKLLEINKNQFLVEKESFSGDPYSLLGQVIVIKKQEGKCPGTFISKENSGFDDMFHIFPVERKINSESKLDIPVNVRSFIIDKQLAAGTSFLSYLSAELDSKSAFSVIVNNQAAGLVDMHSPDWRTSVTTWKEENRDLMEDPEVCYLLIVTGFVQKNILRKKFYQLEGDVKGGAYGINLNGKAFTSSEDYAMDIRFVLEVAKIREPLRVTRGAASKENGFPLLGAPSEEEMALFRTISKIN